MLNKVIFSSSLWINLSASRLRCGGVRKLCVPSKRVRGDYGKIERRHLTFFEDLLSKDRMVTDQDGLSVYNVDFYRQLKGASKLVLKPKTTDEVSKILAFCNENKLAVCPQGGNTGMVGGCTPVFDEIILTTELMNKIIEIDETSALLVCESGCILEETDAKLAEKNLIFPLDLGAKGSCHIGGNVATNAGGLRLMKYGNLHSNVLGLEVVKANGEVLDLMSTMKKDNTGYHLKNLFIGSEGTLGVITKVAIECKVRPVSIQVAFLGLQNFDKVTKTFRRSRRDLDGILSAFEVMDHATMELVREKLNVKSPIGEYPFYVLIETSGNDEDSEALKLTEFLETCLNKHLILNGTVTGEPSKRKELWSIRENIPMAIRQDGYVFLYDLSLPLEYYYSVVEDMRRHMGNMSHRVFGFGHLGDRNLHLQVSVKEHSDEVKRHIEPYIFDKTFQYKGSISAEHGVGLFKAKYMTKIKPGPVITTMRDIKRVMDPNSILNPYKVIV